MDQVTDVFSAAREARDWLRDRVLDIIPEVDKPATEARIAMLDQALESQSCELSGSEAVYGFAGWLTSRRGEPVVLSSNHDAGVVAELVHEFNERNGLAEPRRDWQKRLVPPPDQKKAVAETCHAGSGPRI